MLEIVGLKKTYSGGKCAVDNLSLTVMDGDIFGFIGHNGAGKTTAIRCIVGALDFEEGDILIDRVSIIKEPIACKSKIAYVPDNPDIYEYLTGIQYIKFIADIFSVPQQDREERVKKYADALELTNDLDSLVSSYSHGMKQKLMIIASLVHQPRLLLLDEPFVGLDPKASFTLKNIMHELAKEGCSIFFSTHVLDVAEKLCNKVAIIKQGKLIAMGDMDKVKGDSSLETVFMELIEK